VKLEADNRGDKDKKMVILECLFILFVGFAAYVFSGLLFAGFINGGFGQPNRKAFVRDAFYLPMQIGIVCFLIIIMLMNWFVGLIIPAEPRNGWGDII
jgi:ABC-type antimicrobial peptide transport system permease subunit